MNIPPLSHLVAAFERTPSGHSSAVHIRPAHDRASVAPTGAQTPRLLSPRSLTGWIGGKMTAIRRVFARERSAPQAELQSKSGLTISRPLLQDQPPSGGFDPHAPWTTATTPQNFREFVTALEAHRGKPRLPFAQAFVFERLELEHRTPEQLDFARRLLPHLPDEASLDSLTLMEALDMGARIARDPRNPRAALDSYENDTWKYMSSVPAHVLHAGRQLALQPVVAEPAVDRETLDDKGSDKSMTPSGARPKPRTTIFKEHL